MAGQAAAGGAVATLKASPAAISIAAPAQRAVQWAAAAVNSDGNLRKLSYSPSSIISSVTSSNLSRSLGPRLALGANATANPEVAATTLVCRNA